jgi:N-dimethylarginine dimethylaminohydrolase
MCPPEFYGIHYEINPWMDRRRDCSHDLAAQQWQGLRAGLEDAGASIACLTAQPGLPDLVFTANAALVYGDRAVLSRFRHAERRGEEPHFEAWLAEQGLRVERLPESMYFEGAGDALFCGATLFAGYRIRSDVVALQEVARRLECRVIPLELVDPYFYHLDTCFCPLAPGVALYYPGAFDAYGRRALEAGIGELIEVEPEEARNFACNAVVVGKTVLTNSGCPALHSALRSQGFNPRETPLSEFVKAGGSAKCLTLRMDGEEAAAWRLRSAASGTSGHASRRSEQATSRIPEGDCVVGKKPTQ